MKFKNNKPVQCTRKEFELVQGIIQRSCLAEAALAVHNKLINGTISWKCETRTITTRQAAEMAFYTVQAVKNGYKYLKIVEEKQ